MTEPGSCRVLIAVGGPPAAQHAAVTVRRLFGEQARLASADATAGADLELGDPLVQPHLSADELAAAILEAARERRADVIVLGDDDRGWLERLLAPRATRQVATASDVPVLVVKRSALAAQADDAALRVIVATDGGPGSEHAARAAGTLFGDRARYEVVHIAAPRPDPMADADGFAGPLLSEQQADEIMRASIAEGNAIVGATAELVGGQQVTTTVITGDPGTQLCDHATETSTDVLVVGSSGTSGLLHLLVGSVSAQLIAHCDVPLLIVPALPS